MVKVFLQTKKRTFDGPLFEPTLFLGLTPTLDSLVLVFKRWKNSKTLLGKHFEGLQDNFTCLGQN